MGFTMYTGTTAKAKGIFLQYFCIKITPFFSLQKLLPSLSHFLVLIANKNRFGCIGDKAGENQI
jgi:hypothetical protein